jgi:hypothetical protein
MARAEEAARSHSKGEDPTIQRAPEDQVRKSRE